MGCSLGTMADGRGKDEDDRDGIAHEELTSVGRILKSLAQQHHAQMCHGLGFLLQHGGCRAETLLDLAREGAFRYSA